MHKRGLIILAIFLLLSMRVGASDIQTMDINVQPVNEISLSSSLIHFDITDTGVPFIDDSTILNYKTNESSRKITVGVSSAVEEGMEIKISPLSVSNAIGNTVVLDNNTAAYDLITSLGNTSGSCGLEYSVTADETVPPGTYNYEVTYTIIAE